VKADLPASSPQPEKPGPRPALTGALVLLAAWAVLAGCTAFQPILPATPFAGPATPRAAAPSATPTVEPITLPTPLPPRSTPTPVYPWLTGEIRVFPGPAHFLGDLLTFEVAIGSSTELEADDLPVLAINGVPVDVAPFIAYSPLREDVVVYRWAWDTSGIDPNVYTVTVDLPPSVLGPAQRLEARFVVNDTTNRPAAEFSAAWASVQSDCCLINYITGTAAARDREALRGAAESAVAVVEDRLGLSLGDPVTITFIDNIWGNGAFASEELVVSYVDRSYTGFDLETVLRHEFTHRLMQTVGSGQTPILLSEGVATYLAGGHYQVEPIPQRAAALLALDAYVPLADLLADFRAYQHEAAYIEAASLVCYLVETYGMDSFLALYSHQSPDAAGPVDWMESALSAVYGLSTTDLEHEYASWLAGLDPAGQADDLRLSIALHDTVRRYQDLYAPYQEALPPSEEAVVAGQVAEYMREPTDLFNLTLEVALVEADRALAGGDYTRVEVLLAAINGALDDASLAVSPLCDYADIVRVLLEERYEVQSVSLGGDRAEVRAIGQADPPFIRTFIVERSGSAWQIVP
jgi:hypothetical protein